MKKIPFVKRNSAKLFDLLNIASFGIGGPNKATSFDRVTATLQNGKRVKLQHSLFKLQNKNITSNVD